MTRVAAIVLAVTLSAAAVDAQQPIIPPGPLTLEQLERLALEWNPTLGAARAESEIAKGRAKQAGALPNPVVTFTAESIPLTPPDPGKRPGRGFFVEQTIPLGGKLSLGRQVFERAQEEAAARADLQQLRVLTTVRALYYQVLATERRVEVQQRLTALGAETVSVLAQLFNVGVADRPDFLAAEVAGRQVQLKMTAARNQLFALRQQLANAVGTDEVVTAQLAGTIDAVIPELERETILKTLMDANPRLRAARASLARARAVTAAQRKLAFPDLFLRGGADFNRDISGVTGKARGWTGSIEVGISVPLFNRNGGGVDAARAAETFAEAEVRRVELSLRAMAAPSFATYLTALRAAEAYREEMLPSAEEGYRMYLTRYRQMGAAYPQVMSAQQTLFELSDQYLESLDQAWRAALRLQGMLAGDALQSPASSGDDEQMMMSMVGSER